jgi:hypothetical protein
VEVTGKRHSNSNILELFDYAPFPHNLDSRDLLSGCHVKIEPHNFEPLPESADQKRQAEWRERSLQKIKARRKWRLDKLTKEKAAIQRAVGAYSVLDRGDVPWVVLRRRFIRLGAARQMISAESEVEEPRELSRAAQARERRREIDTRPPLTRLVHRQSNALSLYLTAIYVAHLEAKPGRAFDNRRYNTRSNEDDSKSWSWLAGLSVPREIRSRRARMRRALDELVAAGLINIQPPGVHYRYESWLLLKEDGSESQYRVPSERESDAIQLPATFFLKGWHLVLTPGEIAMLLVIMDMARSVGRSTAPGNQQWVALPRSIRRDLYGLTGEIYLHAQQLREFGLVDFQDPMATRRRGKISAKRIPPRPPADDNAADAQHKEHKPPSQVPYLFSLRNPAIFDRDAFTVVHATLSALTIPYRLDANAALISPQDLVKSHLEARQSHGSL